MNREAHHHHLIHLLQGAYSGELAAGFAYRGHWKSVRNEHEHASIQKIEREEWIHRECVGEMLKSLAARPKKSREAKMWLIGKSIGAACHVIGWFLPMYFAGRLESGNVIEYETAASHAAALGFTEFEADLLVMAGVEKEHELFFLSTIVEHRLLPLISSLFGWGNLSHTEAQLPQETVTSEAVDASIS